MHKRLIIFSAMILLLASAFASAGDYKIKGKFPTNPVRKADPNLGVCDRNILQLDHSGKYGLPQRALSDANPRVVRILAIKVQFKKETPDDPTTTGDGNFDLRTKEEFKAAELHTIDPAPHNSPYFLKHIEAMTRYWNVASNDRVRFEYEIYPKQADSSYQLDSSMAFYGAQLPQFGLGEFFYDAWNAADVDTAIHFFNTATGKPTYDAYVVFHAGADQQGNVAGRGTGGYSGRYKGDANQPDANALASASDFIDTPADLYTGYIKIGQPFYVDSGEVLISDGVIVPESISQDGRVTALNAVFGHEFGHQLGLVDLYDTRTGNTTVGDFSLMDDNGFGINIELAVDSTTIVFLQGAMPIFPDAWSRAYLGFVDVVEKTSASNIHIAAAELDTTETQVVLVPINADEYYLIENRRTDLDGDDQTNLKADTVTGVFLGPATPVPAQQISILNREYDYLTPGSGMLIWHVDELAARLDYNGDGIPNFDQNQLQWFNFPQDERKWDNRHQFLTVVEADGHIEFGREYFAGYGNQSDLFDINGNDNFGPFTNPPTSANNGGYTGITINDISAPLLVMSCDIKVEGRLSGWPNYIGKGANALSVSDLLHDGSQEIIVGVDNYVLAYKLDGNSFYTPTQGTEVIVQRPTLWGDHSDPDTLAVLGRVASDRKFVLPLAVGDLNEDGAPEIVGVTSKNTLACFTTKTLSFSGEAIKTFEVSLDAPAAIAPIILKYSGAQVGNEVLVYTQSGDKLVFDKDGNRIEKTVAKWPFRIISDSLHHFELMSPVNGLTGIGGSNDIKGAAAADFDRNGTIETAEVYFNGDLKINYAQNPVTVNVGGPIYSEIALGDVDNNGSVDILFCGDNVIYGYNFNGTPLANFPLVVNRANPTGAVICPPTLADVDGDGLDEVYVGTQGGEVVGLYLNGDKVNASFATGFPKSAGGTIVTPLVFAKGAGNLAGLFALTKEGEILGFRTDAPQKADWNGIYAHAQNFGSYLRPLPPVVKTAEDIGYVYNYPNPASKQTTVRFSVHESGSIKLSFYNTAGEIILNKTIDALSGVDNEYSVDCSKLSSGVYFCQIETDSGARKHCSIAIVK